MTNIYRIQAFDSTICGYLFVEFIDIMLKAKNMLDYTNSSSSNEYEKNDKIVGKYFQQLKILRCQKPIALFVG